MLSSAHPDTHAGTDHLAGALAVDDAQATCSRTRCCCVANSAYRKLQRALGNAGGGGFIQDDALLVVTAVPQADTSLQVSITDATARRINCRPIC